MPIVITIAQHTHKQQQQQQQQQRQQQTRAHISTQVEQPTVVISSSIASSQFSSSDTRPKSKSRSSPSSLRSGTPLSTQHLTTKPPTLESGHDTPSPLPTSSSLSLSSSPQLPFTSAPSSSLVSQQASASASTSISATASASATVPLSPPPLSIPSHRKDPVLHPTWSGHCVPQQTDKDDHAMKNEKHQHEHERAHAHTHDTTLGEDTTIHKNKDYGHDKDYHKQGDNKGQRHYHNLVSPSPSPLHSPDPPQPVRHDDSYSSSSSSPSSSLSSPPLSISSTTTSTLSSSTTTCSEQHAISSSSLPSPALPLSPPTTFSAPSLSLPSSFPTALNSHGPPMPGHRAETLSDMITDRKSGGGGVVPPTTSSASLAPSASPKTAKDTPSTLSGNTWSRCTSPSSSPPSLDSCSSLSSPCSSTGSEDGYVQTQPSQPTHAKVMTDEELRTLRSRSVEGYPNTGVMLTTKCQETDMNGRARQLASDTVDQNDSAQTLLPSSSSLSSSSSSSSLPSNPSLLAKKGVAQAQEQSKDNKNMSRSPPCPPTSQKTQDGLAMLLGQAISESPQTQMTVGEMCAWIIKRLPTDSCHSLSVLQTLIHHSLTQNKAFRREELTTVATTATNPCASEIWTLQLNAPQSNGPLVPAKRKSTEPTDSGISTNAITTTSTTTMKKSIDTISILTTTPTTITSTHDIVEDTPSPSPEDTRPRRSGRSRRPPKPKEADDYITHSIHLTSRRHASPTTPPTSPPPNKVTEDPPPIKKRGSVKFDKHIITTILTKEHPTTIDTVMRTPVEEPVMMSPRLRRPPQNLSEFVSSEDFKAAPCGKRMDRAFTACGHTTPSSLSPVAVDGGTRTVRPDRKDKKRSKSESNVSNAANNILTANIATTASTTSPPTQTTYSAKPTKPTMEATSTEVLEPQPSRGTNINPRPRPVSIPLSALSHSKRRSEDFSTCFQRSGEVKKRQRRSQSVQLQSMTLDHHHQRRDFPSRHEIYEQRRQYRLQRSKHGKRGGSGDDEEDSDSDFDFLKEEEENYRMRILTAKRQLALTGRLGRLYESGDEYEDEVDEDEVYLRELEGHEGGRRKTFARCRDQEGEEAREKRGITGGGCGQEYERSCRAEGERIKLLMDPSVITYGFDSCDGQYILDYNQGPLFNNVTWPEFSDLKDLKGINPNHGGSVNSNGHDHIEATISDQGALETRLSTTNSSMDAALEADKDGVPLALSSVFPALAGCGPEVAFASTDIKSRHMDSDAEAKEWGLLMGQGGGRPSIEGNTVMDRRLERQLSLSSLFSLLSAKQEPLRLIPEVDAEMSPADTESLVKLSEDILAGVAAEDDLLAGTGCKAEDTSKAGVVPTGEEEEEDVQVEEFIGLSWCQ